MMIRKRFWSIGRTLFITVVVLFVSFAATFMMYQYHREKNFKIELLEMQLHNNNDRLYQELRHLPDSARAKHFAGLVREFADESVRVTIIDPKGEVLLESVSKKPHLANHFNRPEIQKALRNGSGYDLRRTSETTGIPYFYVATFYPDQQLVIRSAMPYSVDLVKHLAADSQFIYFTSLITLVLIMVIYIFANRIGGLIARLQNFASSADKDEPIEINTDQLFPHNELEEISNHIIQIYHRLRKTKQALYIEREKLITHLQTSHEGLGVFTRDKKEILVNSLFTQYGNLISDTNLKTTEDIFAIKEFSDINDFVNHETQSPISEEKRRSVTIEKNAHIFWVECIIFKDLSFEISINDITLDEEQARLKRQLTQNIAHELKTPVSSIQGYLETLIENPDMDLERCREFLSRCYAQSNRLSALLHDISLLNRMDDGQRQMNMEEVNITQIMSDILNEEALELEEKHITVENQLQPNLKIKGNYSLIYSIFRNLTDNAIAYAGTCITIRVSCFRQDERMYYFSFSDTGVGVAPEHLGRLFERFYRVDKGRSRKLGGTGLGLAIVKNGVQIHGGTIMAKNNLNGGLEFIFTLRKEN